MSFWSWRKKSDPAAAAEKERRTSQRLPPIRVTSCVLIRLPENSPVTVAIKDLSTGGFGFICRKPIELGKFLAVDLQGANKFSRVFRVQVVHCTVQKDSTFLLGCIHVNGVTDEDLEPFV